MLAGPQCGLAGGQKAMPPTGVVPAHRAHTNLHKTPLNLLSLCFQSGTDCQTHVPWLFFSALRFYAEMVFFVVFKFKV